MAYRDSTTANANGSPPVGSVPAGVAADDIIILVVTRDLTSVTVDPADWPSGFAELSEVDITAPDGQGAAIGWKRSTGSEPANYTFGDIGGNNQYVVQAYAFSGRDTTNPPTLSSAVSNTGNASGSAITASTVTALDGDDLLWVFAADPSTSGGTSNATAPTNFTEREDDRNQWSIMAGATRDNVSAGATGSVSGSMTISSGTFGYAVWLVRIPAAGGGGGTPAPDLLGITGVGT